MKSGRPRRARCSWQVKLQATHCSNRRYPAIVVQLQTLQGNRTLRSRATEGPPRQQTIGERPHTECCRRRAGIAHRRSQNGVPQGLQIHHEAGARTGILAAIPLPPHHYHQQAPTARAMAKRLLPHLEQGLWIPWSAWHRSLTFAITGSATMVSDIESERRRGVRVHGVVGTRHSHSPGITRAVPVRSLITTRKWLPGAGTFPS